VTAVEGAVALAEARLGVFLAIEPSGFEDVQTQSFANLPFLLRRGLQEVDPEHLVLTKVTPPLDLLALPLIEQVRAQHESSRRQPNLGPER
jgi:hypothetical protein